MPPTSSRCVVDDVDADDRRDLDLRVGAGRDARPWRTRSGSPARWRHPTASPARTRSRTRSRRWTASVDGANDGAPDGVERDRGRRRLLAGRVGRARAAARVRQEQDHQKQAAEHDGATPPVNRRRQRTDRQIHDCPTVVVRASRHRPTRRPAAPSPQRIRGMRRCECERWRECERRGGHGDRVVRRQRARSSVARSERQSVGGAGQRDHAAADAGTSGAAGVDATGWHAGRRRPRSPSDSAGRSDPGLGPARLSAPGAAAAHVRDRARRAPRRRGAQRCRRAARAAGHRHVHGATPWPRSRSRSGPRSSTRTYGGSSPGRSAARPTPVPATTPADLRAVEALLPERPAVAARASAAFMEIGALICTARSPKCADLPDAGAGAPGGRNGSPPSTTAGPETAGLRRHRSADPGCADGGAAGVGAVRSRVPSWICPGRMPTRREKALASLIVDGLAVEVRPGVFALIGDR